MAIRVQLWVLLTAIAASGLAGLPASGDEAVVERVTAGLVVLYTCDDGAGGLVRDTGGVGEALDLKLSDPMGILWSAHGGLEITGEGVAIASREPATKLFDAAQKTNQLTIEAVVTPLDEAHDGPARIVSLSQDGAVRNFTLAQSKDQYVLRLRTSDTDAQGMPNVMSDAGSLRPERQHVVATYDGSAEVRIYVNGELKGQVARTGDFSTWDHTFHLVIGNEYSFDRQWHGTVELVAIYNLALTPAEVARNYAASIRPK